MKRPTPIISSPSTRFQKKSKLIGRRVEAMRGLYFARYDWLEIISEVQQHIFCQAWQ